MWDKHSFKYTLYAILAIGVGAIIVIVSQPETQQALENMYQGWINA